MVTKCVYEMTVSESKTTCAFGSFRSDMINRAAWLVLVVGRASKPSGPTFHQLPSNCVRLVLSSSTRWDNEKQFPAPAVRVNWNSELSCETISSNK